jgi:hypothetical protein
MPNWFYFTLDVSGKEKDVQEFVQNVKGSEKFETEDSDFDFNHFIPQPDDIFRGDLGDKEEDECKKSGRPNWYDWNCMHWGTKWNASVDNQEGEGTNYHTYNLSTAWAFPSPVINEMIEKYPHLSFEIQGEEETESYGVYIKHDNGNTQWLEEDAIYIDEFNGLEVYYSNNDHCWRYMESNEAVEDSDNFYPRSKYSWNQ